MALKKALSILMILMLTLCLSLGAVAAETDAFLAQLEGTYDELFTVMCASEYDHIWTESCIKYAGEEAAPMYEEMLKTACCGRISGEEALAAYAADPESAQFDCYFRYGVHQLTFSGNQISGTDESGNELFSHNYRFIGNDEATGFALYQSDDADSGDFTYFMMAPDTPAETFHIEFRYGPTLNGIGEFYTGDYAYWLAAGMKTPYTEQDVIDVIDLFCEENILAEEEAA